MSQKGSHQFSKVRKVSKMVIFDKKQRKNTKKRQKGRFFTFEKVRGKIRGAHFVEKWVRNTTF